MKGAQQRRAFQCRDSGHNGCGSAKCSLFPAPCAPYQSQMKGPVIYPPTRVSPPPHLLSCLTRLQATARAQTILAEECGEGGGVPHRGRHHAAAPSWKVRRHLPGARRSARTMSPFQSFDFSPPLSQALCPSGLGA